VSKDLLERIYLLKQKRKAIILSHNYQLPEVQDIADFVGDSLGLSQIAAKSDAEVIVFCGVHFMAETASILCPDKIILMPELESGCPMADMIDASRLEKFKERFPGAKVVCYVNTTAEVKAASDICCTSANAAKVVSRLEGNGIIFVPDKYLGSYISKKINRKLILWNGFCPTHVRIRPEHIIELKKRFPDAEVIVHPECTPDVIALADKVLSTTGMCKYAKETTAKRIIVGTECGIIYRLKKENPQKDFLPATELAICPNMKLNTLEKIMWSLEEMSYQIKVPRDVQLLAKRAVEEMLAIGRED
jgi:quinolinate synthase